MITTSDSAASVTPIAQADALVAVARARLHAELARVLLPAGAPVVWATLLTPASVEALSSGALVHCLRLARRGGQHETTRELFVLLLRRTDWLTRRWAQRAASDLLAVHRETRGAVAEDLEQELTLYVWERVALRGDESWEIFFQRALDFAQRHVVAAYMERQGYWKTAGVRVSGRGRALSLVRLEGQLDAEVLRTRTPAGDDPFAGIERAALRLLVLQLPERERIAVVLSYWQGANQREIAAALGVTTRTVRSLLQRAYERLAVQYDDEGGC